MKRRKNPATRRTDTRKRFVVKLHPMRTAVLSGLALLAWLILSEPGTALLLLGALDVEVL